MTIDCIYSQPVKIAARHKSLLYAVNLLTSNRNKSCCVERDYVRKVYDYFMSLNDCRETEEARKINVDYINHWEKLHDSCVSHKRPEDLVVCYLAGPEPHNDFKELTNLGILSQNIWAFESDLGTYKTALMSYDTGVFPQPKIIKLPIESFFMQTPKKFDIVYIDACGAIPSHQHALRCVATLCKYHRLHSPGAIITNFSIPNVELEKDKKEYCDLMSQYFLFKKYPNERISFDNGEIISKEMTTIKDEINSSFAVQYGEYVSSLLRDIGSIIVPVQRFANSAFFTLMNESAAQKVENLTIECINDIRNNALAK